MTKPKTRKEKRELNIYFLHSNADTETTFICSECDEEGVYGWDAIEAAEEAYGDGWRSKDYQTWCPKCVKKILDKRNESKSNI